MVFIVFVPSLVSVISFVAVIVGVIRARLHGVAAHVRGHHSYLRARTGLSRAAWKEG